MTNEQRKAIDRLKQLKDYSTTYYGSIKMAFVPRLNDDGIVNNFHWSGWIALEYCKKG